MMSLNKILNCFSMTPNGHKDSHTKKAMVKMQMTIARLQQTKRINLLRTDYLE